MQVHVSMCCREACKGDGVPTSPALLCPAPAGDLRSEAGRAHVDACHALYCAALQKLYDEHKDKYAPNRVQDMQFIE